MLIASSPVEIDVEATEAGLSTAAHQAARELFHTLTDRLAQAVVALSVPHHDWPTHRFYFSTEPGGLTQLLAGLHARPDIVDVTQSIPPRADRVDGLYCRGEANGFEGVLVGHQSHEGYLSPHQHPG